MNDFQTQVYNTLVELGFTFDNYNGVIDKDKEVWETYLEDNWLLQITVNKVTNTNNVIIWFEEEGISAGLSLSKIDTLLDLIKTNNFKGESKCQIQ